MRWADAPPSLAQCVVRGAGLPAAKGGLALTACRRSATQVVLWRADAVAGVAELDGRSFSVTRADEAVGLMFGGGPKALLKKDFRT